MVLALSIALPISSCGSSSDSPDSGTGNKPAATSSEALPQEGSSVSTAIPGKVGRVVVDQVGFTLYHFSKDKKDNGDSACYDACAKAWPPYLTLAMPWAAQKAKASLIGTFKRKDGTMQLTYGGWPLYTYSKDRVAETKGFGRESFGGIWYPIDVNGDVAR